VVEGLSRIDERFARIEDRLAQQVSRLQAMEKRP
jgi:hypothetical protein